MLRLMNDILKIHIHKPYVNSAYICITMEASHALKPTEKEMWVFTHTTTPPVEFVEGDYFKHQGEWIFLLSLVFSESFIDATLFSFSTLPSLLSSKRHWENTRLPLPHAPNTSSPHPCISQSSPCSCSQLNSPGSLPSPASLIRPPIPSPFAFARTWLWLFPLSFLLPQV